MQTWSRLVPFITPHWRRLLLSLLFGGLSALLWSAELALTYPLTIMFGEHHSVPSYVRHEIEHAAKQRRVLETEVADRNAKLAALPDDPNRSQSEVRLRLLNEVRRREQQLKIESQREWLLNWVEMRLLPRLPKDPFHLIVTLFGLVLTVSFLKGGSSFIQDSIAGSVAERVTIELRQSLFRRTLRLDPQTVTLSGTQKLMTDFTYTLQQLSRCLGDLGGRIIREPLKAGTCIVSMFLLNWQLTCLLLVFVPPAGWMFHVFGQRLKRATRRVLDSVGQIYRSLEETLVNSKAVIAFNAAGRHRRQFHRRNRENYAQSQRLVRINAISAAAVEVFVVSAVLFVLLPAAYLVLRDTTSIAGVKLASIPPTFPELAMFYALLAGVIDPLRKFSKFYNVIRQTGVLTEQFFRQMDRESLVPVAAVPHWLPRLAEGLEFRDIHFSYARTADDTSPDRGPVLNGLDLRIECGEVIAIVGPNGSGKSTLAGLITRFFDPSRGAVLFDGLDLRDVRLQDLRDQMALVPQDTLLFDDTIAANIRYGKPGATDEELRVAARGAHVLDFAESLPQGLETTVGEGGRQLSGGQRQRVALARAMLRDPRLLLLDEPTSAVDAESELLIHRALKDFVRGRTTLIITHSLSPALLEYVTRIVVLDRGRAVATGTHAQLLAACPIYQRLFEAPLSAAA